MIEISNLSKSFAEEYVFHDVSATFPSGQWIGLTGASGSGKTTLLRILLGLIDSDGGSLRWKQEYLIQEGVIQPKPMKAWRQQLAWTPQNVPFASQTPREAIHELQSFNANNRGDISEEAPAWFPQLGLPSTLLDQPFLNLSGGQYQRVLLGLGFQQNRNWWLMDEPTSALDLDSRKRVLDLLQQKQGTSLLISTHDDLLIEHCDQVFEFKNQTLHRR